jgi:hypothetical protein
MLQADSHAYPFQPRFEILTMNRQEGGRYVIDFKDGQNFGEPQHSKHAMSSEDWKVSHQKMDPPPRLDFPISFPRASCQ